MKRINYLLCFLLLATVGYSCVNDVNSLSKEESIEQKAQKNLNEIKAYMVENGLNPDDIRLIDPSEAANPEVVAELKKQIDSYVKKKANMKKHLENEAVVREKMKKAKTNEEIEKLMKEYPEYFPKSANSQKEDNRKN